MPAETRARLQAQRKRVLSAAASEASTGPLPLDGTPPPLVSGAEFATEKEAQDGGTGMWAAFAVNHTGTEWTQFIAEIIYIT